jgi:ribonuclease HII
LNPKKKIRGLADSKKLTPAQREELFAVIQRDALAWQIAFVEVEIIDRLNILHATMEGMRQAICGLPIPAQRAVIDGNRIPPNLPCPADALVNGDNLDRAIMAASILAKVSRDRHMRCLDAEYPGYGFADHKGYSTPEHLAALERLKPCLQHRRSFAPVRRLLEFALE